MKYSRVTLTLLTSLALAATACTAQTPQGDPQDTADQSDEAQDSADQPDDSTSSVVRVVSHDSFNLPDEVFENFTEETGYELGFSAPGDAGALVNQLILTKDSPLGDVVYGVDNSFAARAVDAGV